MAELDGEGGASEDPGPGIDPGGADEAFADDARFDASQYAFFGKDVVEEVELGGLEDDDFGGDPGFGGIGQEDYQFSGLTDRVNGEGLGAFSDIDDLAGALSKLNKGVSEPRNAEIIGHRGSFSRESSSTADWAQEPGFSNWLDQQILDAENVQDGNRWSHPDPSVQFTASRPLYRTSSYPEQQQFSPSEPILVPRPPHTSFPLPGGLSNMSPNQSLHRGNSSPNTGFQMPFTAPNPSTFPQFRLPGAPHGSQYGGNMTQFGPSGPSVNGRHGHLFDRSSALSGEHFSMLPNLMQNQLPPVNGPMPSQLLPQQQHGMHLAQPLPPFSNMQSQLLGPHHSPQMMNKFDVTHGMADLNDLRFRQTYKARQNIRYYQQGFDSGNQKFDNGWPQFRPKYMTMEELESILRMQHAATHSNDPYVDDYYHQACLAKKSVGSRLKHHFSPNLIRDLPSRARAKDEPHAFLQVDALGRLPFSSIRRPRPLLEVEPQSTKEGNTLEQKSSTKPLEQEPMLAARITIEDGFCLLLDVDDIDRSLQFNQSQDGGVQLRRKREVLLEGLAASLQLVDPLGFGKSSHSGLAPNDDLVFLRLVSLPKGRKFLSRYLKLLIPGSELCRVVCMAIFRHLRFLFGALPLDSGASESTSDLAKTVSSCVCSMDLNGLSACLAAVVCSSEQPPLRPLGSVAGDGATFVLKSVLERATELLTNLNSASNYSIANRNLWQASFNAFFELLAKYCLNKYDSIMQAFLVQAQNSAVVVADATRAISKEMPVDLLRASIPHTDERQKKQLLDFAQRSMPISGTSSYGGSSGPINSQQVPG